MPARGEGRGGRGGGQEQAAGDGRGATTRGARRRAGARDGRAAGAGRATAAGAGARDGGGRGGAVPPEKRAGLRRKNEQGFAGVHGLLLLWSLGVSANGSGKEKGQQLSSRGSLVPVARNNRDQCLFGPGCWQEPGPKSGQLMPDQARGPGTHWSRFLV